MSAGHNFRLDRNTDKLVGVRIGISGRWINARHRWSVIEPDDMSLISLVHPGKLLCVPLSPVSPAVGTEVRLVGYPKGGHFKIRTANVLDRSLRTTTHPIKGESGGGVYFNRNLVGIIWGGRGETRATNAETLTQFVMDKLGSMPRCGRLPANTPPPNELKPPAPPIEDETPAPTTEPSTLMARKLERLEQRVDDLKRDLATIRLQKGDKGDKGTAGDSVNVTELTNVVAGQQQLIEKIMGRLVALESKRIHVAIKEQSGGVSRKSFAGTGDDPIRLQLPTRE